SLDTSSLEASGLLYRDMQNARKRAAEREGDLLKARVTELHQPEEAYLGYQGPLVKTKATAGSKPRSVGVGFKASGKVGSPPRPPKPSLKGLDARGKRGMHQAALLRRDGCVRIDGVLTPRSCDLVRACVLREIRNAKEGCER
ncbi:hypothetical protein TrRE_jg1127, partial [Triparma retinervis]